MPIALLVGPKLTLPKEDEVGEKVAYEPKEEAPVGPL